MLKSIQLWNMPAHHDVEFVYVARLPSHIPQQVSSTCKLVYFEAGHKQFRYRGNFYSAAAGDLLLIPSGDPHGAEVTEDASTILRILHLPEEMFAMLLPGGWKIPDYPHGLASPFVTDPVVIQRLCQLHRHPDTFVSSMEQQLRLLDLLEALTEHKARDDCSNGAPLKENRAVRLIKEYIEAHYASEITLACLAQLTGLHPAHLCRLFAHSLGMPPHAYQVAIRIDRSRALLRRGFPVGYVALDTGFYDQSHFSRHFSRLVHMPPAQYARLVKNVQDSPVA